MSRPGEPGRPLREEKLLAVALHGQAALRAVVPRFALRAGLTERGRLRRERALRRFISASGGSAGGCAGPHYCGGGYCG
ncbi:TIGR04222 domain-containing membrane protein, partial [Streptomyces tunisiensis]